MASYEDFQKLDIKVAEIENVIPHSECGPLYVLSIKVGEVHKQIVAGIRAHYTEEQLKGKKIVLLTIWNRPSSAAWNPRECHLAASDATTLTLVVPVTPYFRRSGK